MRLLIDWLQIHPQLPRVQVHAAQAVEDGNNHTLGRGYEPAENLDIDALNARLAASPPTSVDELLAHAAGLMTTATGYHCDVSEPVPPPPAPQPHNAPAVEVTS